MNKPAAKRRCQDQMLAAPPVRGSQSGSTFLSAGAVTFHLLSCLFSVLLLISVCSSSESSKGKQVFDMRSFSQFDSSSFHGTESAAVLKKG